MNVAVQPSQLQLAQAAILRWRNDPVAFVREALNGVPDPWQASALRNTVIHDRVSVRSGHGVGKSTLLAWTIIWWMATHYPVKVACTAPSSHQLYDVLWAEVQLWLRRAIPVISAQFIVKTDRIELVGGGDSFASARTARKENPDALQGFHSDHMLFIIDEAPGVEEVIFEVAAGALSTPGAKQILAGNPTRVKGYFARSQSPGSTFHKMRVSCLDSSRVSRDWIEEMKEEYGEDSDTYRVRVLGEFPKSDSDVLIPTELVDSAVARDIEVPLTNPVWGLDVARQGSDRSCLVIRYPNAVVDAPRVWTGLDTMALTGQVKALWDDTPEANRPLNIFVDVIGLGAGVVDRLAELGLPVTGVNVSESPTFTFGGAFRLRDELWVNALRWFETRSVKLVRHTALVSELTSIRKGYTSSGKTRIESKDDFKKRGHRSPDVADAFVLTFAGGAAVGAGAFTGGYARSDWRKPIKRHLRVVV